MARTVRSSKEATDGSRPLETGNEALAGLRGTIGRVVGVLGLVVAALGLIFEGISLELPGIMVGAAAYALGLYGDDRASRILGIVVVVGCALSIFIDGLEIPLSREFPPVPR